MTKDEGAEAREQVDGVPRLLVLAKARNVLDAFTADSPELTMSQLVARTGLPMSTCVRIVRNLAYDGLLERSGERYRIGLAIVRWGSLALTGRSLVAVAVPALEWLRDASGESAQLCVRDGPFAIAVAAANSAHSIRRQVNVGEVSVLHAGSTGKTFLAFDRDAAAALGEGPLEPFTARTVTDRAQLFEDVAAVRERGYAVSIEERNSGAAGITAPVFDTTGAMVASIGITGPVSRINTATLDRQVELVRDAARRIESQLGLHPAASL